MAIIYGISGIALNHNIARHWNPSLVEKKQSLNGIEAISKSDVSQGYVKQILEIAGEKENYKQYYFPSEKTLMIYLKSGHIYTDLSTGYTELVKVRPRKFFKEINFLHYNKPKRLWTYFSDLFAFSMILLAISGIIMVKGKKGIKGSSGLLLLTGILIPLIFLIIYLW